MGNRSTVIFDFGGVLIEWDPRHLYRKLFVDDEAGMESFLATVCTQEWNRCQDAGRRAADGVRWLQARHPDQAERIAAYYARFDEMMAGPILGSIAVLADLRAAGTPLYGLTNFASETYPGAARRFPFLAWFRGVVVSGEVGAIKPDPRIYEILMERFSIDPRRAVFIDDTAANVQAAERLGMYGIHYRCPQELRAELRQLGLL